MGEAGSEATKEEKLDFRSRCLGFLSRLAASDTAKQQDEKKQAKLERVASWNCLLALHWQLTLFGIPLTKFLPKEGDVTPIHERYHVAINWDTGPDMNCVANYLLFGKQARLCSFPDPLHRINRCLANSASDAGMAMAIQVACIVLNLEHGPFHSQAWWAEERDVAAEYLAMVEVDDPLLAWLAPKIRKDKFYKVESDEDILRELRAGRFLMTKMPRAAPTRWGTLHRGLSLLLDQWHMKLLTCLSLGASQGWLHSDTKKVGIILDKLKVRPHPQLAEESGDKPSVSASMASAAKLRDQCKGTMHLVTSALADETFHFDVAMVDFVGKPLEVWLLTLDKRLRSAPQGLSWYAEAANGEGGLERAFDTLLHPWRRLQDLDRMGFVVSMADTTAEECVLDSDAFLQQQSLFERLHRYLLHTIKHLVLGFAHLFAGYPGRFALLHHKSEEVQKRAWAQMRVDWSAWLRVKNNPNPFWKRGTERSMFRTTAVKEVFEAAALADWTRTSCVDKATKRMFEHFATSLPSEIGFQQLTDAKRDQQSGGLAPHSLWRKLVGRHVLSEEFKYSEINVNETKLALTKANQVPPSCFKPCVKEMDERFSDLPGRGKAPWPSTSPLLMMAQVADQRMLSTMHVENTIDLAGRSWQTCFMQLGLCLLDRKKKLWTVVANTSATAVLWPLRKCKVGPADCLTLEPWCLAALDWRPCVELKDWLVLPTQVVSPMQMLYLNKLRDPEVWCDCTTMVVGKAEPLLQFAAKQGFWNITPTLLKRLHTSQYSEEFEWDPASVCENLLRLIKAVLKCSDVEAARHLARRVNFNEDSAESAYKNMLDSTEAFAAMNSSEQKDCDSALAEHRSKELQMKQLRETVQHVINNI